MDSRMNKYYENDELGNTRFKKNENLYKEINKSELDSYEVKSNTTIIGESEASIDVEKIKKILDTKYNEVPKRQSIRLEETEEDIKETLEDTKEYDINAILEKAKEQKEENYEVERLRKLNDTNYDILKKINVNKKKDDEEKEEDFEKDNLKNLINTIALNEKESHKYNDALDILTDLKGDDDTEVLEGLKEEVNEKNKEEDLDMSNSFYTESNAINKKDLEENDDDFLDEVDSNNTFLKVVIGIIVVIFAIGVILLIKTIYFS